MSRIVNRAGEPSYAGIATFSKLPLALTPDELEGADVAIVGAPFDEAVSNRPGTRYGPRAIRNADDSEGVPPDRPHMLLGVDPFAELNVVDYGDAETVPGDVAASHAAIKQLVADICGAGAVPIILGGDHSVALPDMTAVAEHYGNGNVGVIHFDAHADTGADIGGFHLSHGSPMYHVVNNGSIRGDRFIQVGLRGWWPTPVEFDWMRAQGFRWYTMYELEERGMVPCLNEVIEAAREWDHVFFSVDIDSLDPAYAPGTGTPEIGGLTTRELAMSIRRVCAELPVVAFELVEVSPPYDPTGITAVNAHRLVLEALSGMGLRKSGRQAAPQLDDRKH